MKLTCFFPNFLPGMQSASALRDFGQALEGMGFWAVDAVDHVAYPWPHGEDRRGLAAGGVHAPEQFSLEALTYLAALAPVTRTLRLRTSIIVLPQREPLLLAKQAASIDQLSGGRFELGVGAGWLAAEFAALGAQFQTRGRRMDEALAVITRCWTEDHVTFQGRFFQIDDVGIQPKPLQRPRPPIWIGGGRGGITPPVLRRLGRYGDGWMVSGPAGLDHVPQSLALAQDEAKRVGRGDVVFKLQITLDLVEPGWQRLVEESLPRYQALGADVLCLITIADPALTTLAGHLARLRAFQDEFGSLAAR